MYRLDATNSTDRWRFACPDTERHRDWRVVDGMFECRSCEETYDHLIDLESGESVPREDVEVVGRYADSKGLFGRPSVGDGG